LACFHCQQSAEKYLKGLLQEKGVIAPKTHDLDLLLDLLLPLDSTLGFLRRGLDTLSRYGVQYRYPGFRSTESRMKAALRRAEKVRAAVRDRLGLKI
jgi:HEPN domain-containing protein